MRVRDLLQDKSEVYTVQQDKTIHDAIAILVQHNIGALPVLDQDGNVVGIISERDILRETAHRPGRLKQTCVHERMTRDVIIGVPDDKVEDALALMTKNRIRHLPIMEQGRLVGIISLADAVKACLEEREIDNRYLKAYMFGG